MNLTTRQPGDAGQTGENPDGQSLDFVALDVETANSNRGSVCAMGLVVVRGGDVKEEYSWLTRPPCGLDWFDGRNISIHGIRPSDVVGEPPFADRLGQAMEVIGDLPVIAHNAAFDIGALRGGCDADGRAWPTLTYGCTLVMSRRALDLLSYRLPIVAAELGVGLDRHHDAGADALAAAQILLALARRRSASTLDELSADLGVVPGRVSGDTWTGCHRRYCAAWDRDPVPPGADPDADPDHPLYGQVMVFTGALGMRREDAWARVAELGATPAKDVTRRTTMLVLGDGFTGDDPETFSTGKAAKAAAARVRGQRIEVLTEQDLAELLAETRSRGQRAGAPR